MSAKKQLKVYLDKLPRFKNPKLMKEQYSTPGNVAASVLWNAHMLGDIEDKTILDLGCGTGILGIGALLLGAKRVIFVDVDEEALEICKSSVSKLKEPDSDFEVEFICKDIQELEKIECDTVVMNPPFGTKEEHADKRFLEKAMNLGTIYSFHKTSTLIFLEAFVEDYNSKITHRWNFKYPLPKTFEFHEKNLTHIEVSVFRIV
jgi:putative methylase